jgi:F420-0:gamma-glutamyl ligase-like protein
MKSNLDLVPQDIKVEANTIYETVQDLFGISKTMVMSRTRVYEIVTVRYMIMSLLDENPNCGLGVIGALVNRDHSLIVHGLKEHVKLYEQNHKEYRIRYDLLRNTLKRESVSMMKKIQDVEYKLDAIIEEVINLRNELKKNNIISNDNKGISKRGLLPSEDKGSLLRQDR